jgi:hypothetical protein
MSIITIEEYKINLNDNIYLNMGCLPFPDKVHEIDITTTDVYETPTLLAGTTVVLVCSPIDKRLAVAFSASADLAQEGNRVLMDIREKRHFMNIGGNNAVKVYVKDATSIFGE